MEKIIIDCDPGHDDAIAILLAAGHPGIDLLGITTVAGNQTLPKVTRNALAICAAAGIEVPVAAGASVPLVTPQVVAEDIHGDTGLDGPVLPEPTFELDPRHGVDFIIETVMAHEPKTVHLVPVGPLTNIAMAMRKEPAIIDRVKSVVLMGGAYTRGNSTPCAEFNIYVDPEAAEAVFRGDWEVTMVGLDLTHQALATAELQDRVRAIGGDLSQFVLDIWKLRGRGLQEDLRVRLPAGARRGLRGRDRRSAAAHQRQGARHSGTARPVDQGHDGDQLRRRAGHAPQLVRGLRHAARPPPTWR